MIQVSVDFKEEMKNPARKLRAFLDDGTDPIYYTDDLKTMKIKGAGTILKTIMREAEVTYFGEHTYLGAYVHLGMGCVLPTSISMGAVTISIATPGVVTLNSHGLATGSRIRLDSTGNLPTGLSEGFYWVININANTFRLAASFSDALNNVAIATSGGQSGVHTLYYYPFGEYDENNIEYIDYGSFKVISQESNKGNDTIKIKLNDKMYEALQKYDLTLSYPMTLVQFLQAICTRFGWTLATTTFPNSDLQLISELFSNQQLSFRNILDQIAEASGSIIYFNTDDELVVRQLSDTVLETHDRNTLNSLKVEPHYGPVQSVVLSRMPQEDNIAKTS